MGLSEIVNSLEDAYLKGTAAERVGLLILGASVPTLVVGAIDAVIKLANKYLIESSSKIPLILPAVSQHVGDVPHIVVIYWLSGKMFGKYSKTKRNIILATTTAYYALGELFGSSLAPQLPQILPGTPDIKDIPAVLVAALGIYLINKNRQYFL